MTTSPDPGSTAAASVERSDAELIAATRDGDAVAFGLLYLRHVDAAKRLARTLVRDSAAVDDLVAEAFAKVLSTLRAGHGPTEAFRAYLLTSLRNLFYDQVRRDRRLTVTDDIGQYETGVPFTDTASEGLERSLAARAFRRLPERWQTVLWHTEIEGESPAEVAPLLGLTANGVSALAYRARERLKQMYLQEHIAGETDAACRWAAERLGTRVRDGLSRRERHKVDEHLADCAKCTLLYTELGEINSGLRELIAPVIAGTTWSAYLGLGGATKAAAVAGTGVVVWFQHTWHAVLLWFKGLWTKIGPRNAAIGGGAAVAVALVVGLLLTSSSAPPPRHQPRAAGSQPAAPPGAPPGGQPPGHQPPPAATPPAQHPTAGPTGGHAPAPPKKRQPAPAQPPYRVTPPKLSTGTLSVGDTDSALPITISNPAGGGGGGDGEGLIPFADPTAPPPAAPALRPTDPPTPHPAPGPPVPSEAPALGPVAPAQLPAGGYDGSPGGSPSASASPAPSASPSPSAAGRLTVTITLPNPMTAGSSGAAGSGWTCTGHQATITCTHALLPTGASSTLRPHVDVGSVAGFQPVRVRVAVPGQAVSESFPVVVAPQQMRTAYAATGRAQLVSAGNTLIRGTSGGLLPIPLPLGQRKPCAVNDQCTVVPYHGDGGSYAASSGARSRARVSLPAGARVAYAQLTWAGRGSTGSLPAGVRLIDPSGGTHGVTGAQTTLPGGRQYSANVTSLLANGGGGTWTFATDDVYTGTATGGVFDGWSLQVVVTLPSGPSRNVAVFDGAQQIGSPLVARLGVGTAGTAQLGATLWDGDRREDGRLGDDTLRFGSTTVADVGHSASASAPESAADPNWNLLGTDVTARSASVSADGQLTFSTGGQDKYSVGALAIAGPAG
ncbi:sigma-70 family RNA polymerase sigma factor [Actinocatenispora sera]|uniref:sigma-70 family RNA polymerase sigma factor n=1 Tax=Actinocatenispora sera TaxID=390989 RepID=UPI0034042769